MEKENSGAFGFFQSSNSILPEQVNMHAQLFASNRFAPVPLQNIMLLSISIEKLFSVKYTDPFFPILPLYLYSFGKPDISARAGANLDW